MKVNKVFICFVIAAFACCKPKTLAPEAYLNYVNDQEHGLISSVVIGSFELSVQYYAPEVQAIQEIGVEHLTKEAFDKVVHDKKKLQYYVLKVASADKKTDVLSLDLVDERGYYDRIGYLSGSVDKDITLIEGTDTLPCVMHHFERSYHMTYYNKVILAFEASKDATQDKTIVWNDQQFGLGKVSITIKATDINTTPGVEI